MRVFPILIYLVMSGCAGEGIYETDMETRGSSSTNGYDSSPGPTPGARFDAQTRPNPQAFDLGMAGDRYIPPVRPDAGTLSNTDRLNQCVERMTTFIRDTATSVGCGQFDEEDRLNGSSGYNQGRRSAACIKLSCQGTLVEGHNGIPAARTCSELNDLTTILDRALEQAIDGGCSEPLFQIRVIDLDDFVGGEPCDQISCGLDDAGDPITIDNRN
ncbi:MAG: hypothetical protein CMH52_13070 [Myxococcales bacterium]|nr:hypothetical protein [Myxococcales bacterium]